MPLQSIVATVKSTVARQKLVAPPRYDPTRPIPNLIDATAREHSSASFVSSKPVVSKSTSISAIRRDIEESRSLKVVPNADASWEKCRCLKQSGEKSFCTKFISLCVKDSCPKRFIEA